MRGKLSYLGLGLTGILCYMMPYFILGENAYITIHDFLDQNVAIMAMLKNTGLLTSVTGTAPNMDGLDRSLFPFFMPFDLKMVSYLLLPTFWAIVSYTFLYKIVAFLGMFLLLDAYFFQEEKRWITLFLSLGFTFVPFYMELALSGAGFPLVVYAFLNLYYNKNKGWSYVAIAFYAFNSLLAYGGFFFLVILFCCMLGGLVRTKRISMNVICGGFVLGFVYLLANWGTFYSLFFSDSFVSHRTEWVHSSSLYEDLFSYIKIILHSQYHAGTVYAAPILFLSFFIVIRYWKKYPLLRRIVLLYGLVAAGILMGLLLMRSHIQLFVSIQFDRFYFFYPSVLYLLLAACCYVMVNERLEKFSMAIAAAGLLVAFPFDYEWKKNAQSLLGIDIKQPTFTQFYDVQLFSKIKDDLVISSDYSTKTVSLGMFPAVPEYNGFYTLDSYRVNYPLEYKKKFRKVIAAELEKNEEVRKYFDEWGSRCYLVSSELSGMSQFGKTENKAVEHLDIDIEALKELGCRYILSAVEIKNYHEIGLAYLNNYTTDSSYWDIRVYELQ